MSNKYGHVDQALWASGEKSSIDNITIGRVIDTNDPQQMGRIRAFCPAMGDTDAKKVKSVPWAMSVSPLAGVSTSGERGSGDDTSSGPIAYGMWNIPKVGAQVLIACVDGDTSIRVWLGCLQPQYFTHTLPHGRYLHSKGPGTPEGPLTTDDLPIQPLYDNQTRAFSKSGSSVIGTPSTPRDNLEWRSRGADFQASAVNSEILNSPGSPGSDFADDFGIKLTEEDGREREFICSGYSLSRLEPEANYDGETPGGYNYDNQVYSWTTPGFHSISMDDRQENNRMRFRTTGGNQIILDDTNERIYLSTAEGQTWIEIDHKGNIDIFGQRNISVSAGGDINLTSAQSVRMHGKEGIHLTSEGDIRAHANKDVNIRSNDNIRTHSGKQTLFESNQQMHINTHDSLMIHADNEMHIDSSNTGYFTTGGVLHINSGGNTLISASPDIHLNGPSASKATSSEGSKTSYAYMSSRIPEHEPWARVHAGLEADQDDSANVYKPEYDYAHENVGRKSEDRNEDYTRNTFWRR